MSPALPYAATKLLEMAEIAQQSSHIYLCALFLFAHVTFTCLIMFLNLTVFCHHRSHAAIPDQFSRTIMMDTK